MKTYIKGNYRRSIFESDSGYVIGLFKVKETNLENMDDYLNKTITFTGYFHNLNTDDDYIFYGEELEHPKYGFQFQVSEYERMKPTGKDGIVEFLSSDLFNGIGNKMASKIVDVLGESALDRILEEPESLMLVPKLTKKKADMVVNTLKKYEESHQTIVYLNDLGFNMRDSLNIYNHYKSDTMTIIEHNIYSILDEIADVNFNRVDEIANKKGYDKNDERRVKAAIVYAIDSCCFSNGDTYLLKEEIMKYLKQHLNIELDSDTFFEYLYELQTEDKVVVEDERIYLSTIYDAERNIAYKICRFLSKENKTYKKLDILLEQLEKDNNIIYNDKQKKAIKTALTSPVTIITGGPGTGKTTIIKAIIDLYGCLNHLSNDEIEERIALLAPTGRASKRMSESTLHGAKTIHRFLKWNKDNNEFAVNEYYPAFNNYIVVDEVSMIDTQLMNNLLKGLTENIQLILVGDANQLPSVGSGQLLKDMIDSDIIPTINLDFLYRQDENSYISTLASEIKNNDISEAFLKKHSDYTFLECSSSAIRQSLKNICGQLLDKNYDLSRIQIMAPMYRGENGIDILNKDLQEVFNPASDNKIEIKYGDVIFRENDKILQLVNMPDENVFNGDIGTISYIIPANRSKSGKNEIYVDYDGLIVKYLPKDFIKIKHGFVITIHKSQGSEFEVVIMPISRHYYRMLYRKLVYTGVTRAKKKLILLGESKAFLYAVSNDNEYFRKTTLKDKLNLFMNSN